MSEDPLKNPKFTPDQGSQEKLKPTYRICTEDDWIICKELRILSMTGPDAEFLGVTPKILEENLKKSDEEWRKETQSREMFSVLSYVGSEPVGLGRAKLEGEGVWRVRNAWTKPEFQRRGIQTGLIALRLKEIIRRGGVKVETSVRPGNPTSLHNVEKFGFKVVDTDDEWHTLELDLTRPETRSEVIKKIDEVLNT